MALASFATAFEGTFEEFSSQGPPLGVMDGFHYRTARHPMSVGDACIVLSDGSAGLFKGAADLVAGLVGKPVADVVSTVHKAIRQAQDGLMQDMDRVADVVYERT